jgi:hypothetical protein
LKRGVEVRAVRDAETLAFYNRSMQGSSRPEYHARCGDEAFVVATRRPEAKRRDN